MISHTVRLITNLSVEMLGVEPKFTATWHEAKLGGAYPPSPWRCSPGRSALSCGHRFFQASVNSTTTQYVLVTTALDAAPVVGQDSNLMSVHSQQGEIAHPVLRNRTRNY